MKTNSAINSATNSAPNSTTNLAINSTTKYFKTPEPSARFRGYFYSSCMKFDCLPNFGIHFLFGQVLFKSQALRIC